MFLISRIHINFFWDNHRKDASSFIPSWFSYVKYFTNIIQHPHQRNEIIMEIIQNTTQSFNNNTHISLLINIYTWFHHIVLIIQNTKKTRFPNMNNATPFFFFRNLLWKCVQRSISFTWKYSFSSPNFGQSKNSIFKAPTPKCLHNLHLKSPLLYPITAESSFLLFISFTLTASSIKTRLWAIIHSMYTWLLTNHFFLIFIQ